MQAMQQQEEAQMEIRIHQRVLSALLGKQPLAAAGPLALAQVQPMMQAVVNLAALPTLKELTAIRNGQEVCHLNVKLETQAQGTGRAAHNAIHVPA